MAQIAVIGISSFGFYVAKKLAELGSEVMAIDKDEAKIDQVKAFVTKALVANSTDRRTLEQLALHHLDWVVLSLGSHLESSLLTAMHLKELGVTEIVAKALSEEHAKILEMMGVKRIVFPERDTGLRIAASLHGVNIVDYLPLGSGLSIVELLPLKEMIGRTLLDLDFRKRYDCQVLAIKEKGPAQTTFIPSPQTRLDETHILIVLGTDLALSKLSPR